MKLANEVAELLVGEKLKLALAESCTGGFVSHILTNVPGASKFFVEGRITYTKEAKRRLGIGGEQVSMNTSLQMAKKVRRIAKTDLGLGITGFCGPEGEEVGTVYICLAGKRNLCRKFKFSGTREEIKSKGAREALKMLTSYLHARNRR